MAVKVSGRSLLTIRRRGFVRRKSRGKKKSRESRSREGPRRSTVAGARVNEPMTTVPRDLSLSLSFATSSQESAPAPLLIFHTVYGPLSGSARSVPLVPLASFFPHRLPFRASLPALHFFSRSCRRVSSTWTSEACRWNFSLLSLSRWT